MDWQSAFTGILVVCCAAFALRRFMGSHARTWLADSVRTAPGGAVAAVWLMPQRAAGGCGGCDGCASTARQTQSVQPLQLEPPIASPALRGIPVRVDAPAQAAGQRACGAASHWRASSTQ
ncbi:MAG: hypothetical protein EBR89_12110 [Betaproteobacteria bacterium]|nr:hypothetical protein [Betaproteobacteria bacterium]